MRRGGDSSAIGLDCDIASAVVPDRARDNSGLASPLLGKWKHELPSAKAGEHHARRGAAGNHDQGTLDELPLVRVRFGWLVYESQRG
jgi:hypothetical protein